MEYSVFNKNDIEINDDLIALYEKEIAPLDDKRIKYLLAGSNVNEISPNLNKVIVEAMIDEISLVKEVPDMIRKAFLC